MGTYSCVEMLKGAHA